MAASRERAVSSTSRNLPEHLRLVQEALERLRFGVIQLTVHDGKLMQFDVTERRRMG
ncbi:YezD family protein [Tsuneonella troitsensis]|jgi:hypothetical protein|uniref:YezD family protein n=1 Tax=Tsuneonella troitsensis TaxID=292222 RepID=UPI0009FAD583|nr:DUF2292 domain-containing protein [Tsuneonella troitsensis]